MISNLFNIKKKAAFTINDFFIGQNHIIILTLKTKKDAVVFDKALSKIFNDNLNVLWFSSHYEMDEYFAYFETDEKDTYFIIIG